MLTSDRPTPDAKRVRTEKHKILYTAGIPSQYWVKSPNPRFSPFKISDIITDVKTQEEWFAKLLNEAPFTLPHLVYISVPTNESVVLAAGFSVLKNALSKGLRVQVDNASSVVTPQVIEPVALLMNVLDDNTVSRREEIRDWIYLYRESFRIICITGDMQTFVNHVRIHPTMAFSLNPNVLVSR